MPPSKKTTTAINNNPSVVTRTLRSSRKRENAVQDLPVLGDPLPKVASFMSLDDEEGVTSTSLHPIGAAALSASFMSIEDEGGVISTPLHPIGAAALSASFMSIDGEEGRVTKDIVNSQESKHDADIILGESNSKQADHDEVVILGVSNLNGKSHKGNNKRSRNDDETNTDQIDDTQAKDNDAIITDSYDTRNAAKKLKRNDTDNVINSGNSVPLESHTDSMEIEGNVADPNDDQNQADELNSAQKTPMKKGKLTLQASPSFKNVKRKTKKKKTREYEYLVTNPDSELVELDMRFFMKKIFSEKRYKKFTKEQRERLIRLVPSIDKVQITKKGPKKDTEEPVEIDEQAEIEYLMKHSGQGLNGSVKIAIESFPSSNVPVGNASGNSLSKDIVTFDDAKLPVESDVNITMDTVAIDANDLSAENADIDSSDLPAESASSTSTIEDHEKELPSIFSQLDAKSTIINDDKRPKEMLRKYFFNDMQFYGCVKAFVEKLGWGHFDPKWIKKNQATQKRLRKTMDEDWKDLKFEAKWGHNLKPKSHMVAGDSASLSLQDLCKAAIIRAGDELHYKRLFKKVQIAVEGIVNRQTSQLDAPQQPPIKPATNRKRKPKNDTDDTVIASNSSTNTSSTAPIAITKLSSLETKVLDDDGSVSKQQRPNGNANKNFRVIRAGRDLGTIFVLRSEFYEKTRG
ncbi:4206_t:CDS:2 [Ambispora leptoticha]|uniref:4206_t:CDS:1 n=1 Tax=Ambispora leptoticha TaxID=144679 RepID=A0A9N8YZI4_9GLOM|nr:4206_t:CDS:2 [Ambispora leptoticha]